jgi:hypothetical protein
MLSRGRNGLYAALMPAARGPNGSLTRFGARIAAYSKGAAVMLDLVFLALGLGLFAAAWAYTLIAERL